MKISDILLEEQNHEITDFEFLIMLYKEVHPNCFYVGAEIVRIFRPDLKALWSSFCLDVAYGAGLFLGAGKIKLYPDGVQNSIGVTLANPIFSIATPLGNRGAVYFQRRSDRLIVHWADGGLGRSELEPNKRVDFDSFVVI